MNLLKLHIPDMHCSSCVMKLEGIEDELPGILKVKASYHKQTLEIDFDVTQVNETQILQVVKELGYTPIKLPS